jgi:hypothetical protein
VGEISADKSVPLGNERERERRARGQTGADRRGPPVRSSRRARGAGPGGLAWAKMAFPFFLEFLIAFLFLFL